MKLSIIVPVYNEEKTLKEVLSRVDSAHTLGLEKEIVVVDDGSADHSREILHDLESDPKHKIIFHEKNKGKGAALITGLNKSSGDFFIIQDADLEYDPNEYQRLLKPLVEGRADVVYGSRMSGRNPIGYWYMYLGNFLVSLACWILYQKKVSDVETCYKAFNKKVLQSLSLKAQKFDFEAEFTAQILKNKFRYVEMPITYHPRKYGAGKKIHWTDGVAAIWTLIKYRF